MTPDEILAALNLQAQQLSAVIALVQAGRDAQAKFDAIAVLVQQNSAKLAALL